MVPILKCIVSTFSTNPRNLSVKSFYALYKHCQSKSAIQWPQHTLSNIWNSEHTASIIRFVYGRGNIWMAWLISISAIWDAMPCSLVHGGQCFEGSQFFCTEDGQQVPPQMNTNIIAWRMCIKAFLFQQTKPSYMWSKCQKNEHCGCRFSTSNPYSACYVWVWMLALWTFINRLFMFVFSPSISLLRKYFRTDCDHFLTKCHLYAPFHLTTHNQCKWKSTDTNQVSLSSDRNCTSSFRHLVRCSGIPSIVLTC